MAQPYSFISKIVTIGDSGSGKSSLTIRLCEGRFVSHHDVTIGVEFGSRIVPVGPPASLEHNINNPTSSQPVTSSPNDVRKDAPKGGKKSQDPEQKYMKLSLWDTAGQEQYKSITRSYFRGASGALLVFDITRRNTFEHVTTWLHDLRQMGEEDIVVILVGNKSDLATTSTEANAKPSQRQVEVEEAERWCKENKVMQYVETSAKSGEGVEKAFLNVSERIWQNIAANRYNLDDRRSGVKRAEPGGGGGSMRTVTLAGNGGGGAKKGGCC